jgi:hypothetical protein
MRKRLLLAYAVILLLCNTAMGQWQPVTIAEGGHLYSLDVKDSALIIQGEKLVFYSSNNGDSWKVVDTADYLTRLYYYKLWGNSILKTQYVAPGQSELFISYGASGLWQALTFTNDSISVDDVAVVNNRIIISANSAQQSGIFYSDDTMQTIHQVWSVPMLGAKLFVDGNNVWTIDSNDHIINSTDGGTTWQQLGTVPMLYHYNNYSAKGDTIVSVSMSSPGYKLSVSIDNGISWTEGIYDSILPACCTGYLPSPVLTDTAIFVTSHKGVHRQNYSQQGTMVDINAGLADIAINRGYLFNNQLYVLCNNGFYTNNGITWQAPAHQPFAGASFPLSHGLIQLSYNKINNTTYRNYLSFTHTPDMPFMVLDSFDATSYAGYYFDFPIYNGELYYSFGFDLKKWDFANAPVSIGPLPTSPVFLKINNGKIYCRSLVSYDDLYASNDLGQTWQVHDTLYNVSGLIHQYANDSIYIERYAPNPAMLVYSPDFEIAYEVQLINDGGWLAVGDSLYYQIWQDNLFTLPRNNPQAAWQNSIQTPLQFLGGVKYHHGKLYVQGSDFTHSALIVSADNGNSWTEILEGGSIPEFSDNYIYSTLKGAMKMYMPLSALNAVNISGKVYSDINNNNTFDTLVDVSIQGALLNTNCNTYTASHQDGSYSISTICDTNAINVATPFQYLQSINPSQHTTIGNATGKDFALHFLPNVTDLEINIAPLSVARPGFSYSQLLIASNKGTTTLGGDITLQLPAGLTYTGAQPSPAVITADSLVWHINPLQPLHQQDITVQYLVDAGTAIGSQLLFAGSFTPFNNDTTPANNFDTLTQVVVGSYDPNIKLVTPSTLTPERAQDNPYLTYTIHFQNTGNYQTDFVRVSDNISTLLDLNTIQVLASSHPYSMEIEGRQLTFKFDNCVLLPQSVNDSASQGFITFKIRPVTALQPGQAVNNRAFIYFDYNAPIVTEYATTNALLPNGINEVAQKTINNIWLWPNPTNATITITTNIPDATIFVTDLTGRTIALPITRISDSEYTLTTEQLPAGMYIVHAVGDKQRGVGRFVRR